MAKNIKITSQGIIKILKNYNYKQALCEFIWNGFDAKATKIEVNFSTNEFGTLTHFEIKDDGYGIEFSKLKEKFEPFFESEKAIEISTPNNTSVYHGKNGVGRLTFFTFAHFAKWFTAYKVNGKFEVGEISIGIERLNTYDSKQLDPTNVTTTGTCVAFSEVQISKENIELEVIPYIAREFCWFLELNRHRLYKILINGVELDYSFNISDRSEFEIVYKESNTTFNVKYIQWKDSPLKEHSKFYFLGENGAEVYKDFTTLNRKGDQYYHSAYIQSNFFKDFNFKSNENDSQGNLFSKAKSSPEYKFLIRHINDFLRGKRKPFLKEYASFLVDQYEQDGILPQYPNEWEGTYRKRELLEIIKELYEVQPKLFNNLNIEQKKTFVRFLDLLLDSNEKENIFRILDEVVDLEPEEREELSRLFKVTRFNRIVDTIKLIEDRYRTYYMLKDLVFNINLNANEVDHLQKVVEGHYWIFGEQYHLVTAAEPKFEEALRRYHYLLYDEDVPKKIEHPLKYKEMDIFACRQNYLVNKIENIVIELKHPDIKIGRNQYTQVDKYLEVILSQPEFNASNMDWEFYLIGKDWDKSGFIDRQLESNANHGIKSLIHWFDNGRIKVYAKRWSEIFTDFELKHKYINDKLRLERNELLNQENSADEIVQKCAVNNAVQIAQVVIPKKKTKKQSKLP